MDTTDLGYLHQQEHKIAWFAYLERLISQRSNDEVISILNTTPSMKYIVDTTNQSLLYVATKYNNMPIMQYLLKSDCDINARDTFGWTPLMVAAKSKDSRPVTMLLNYGADIFVTNSNNQSALQIYLNLNHRKQSLQVLDKFFTKVVQSSRNNEEIFAKLKNAQCRLDTIVHLCNPEVTKMSLDQRNHIENFESNRSVVNCMTFMCEENLKMILQYGVDVEERRRIFLHRFYNIIHKPKLSNQDLEKFEFFVRLITDLKFLNENTCSYGCLLFIHSPEELLEIMIQSDINAYIKSEFDYEPITYIFGNSNSNILKFIKRAQINVHARGIEETTALHLAVERTMHPNVKYLLEMGVDPNVTDKYGDTPIFFVFDEKRNYCDETSLLLLLNHGANLQHCNDESKTFIEEVTYTDEYENVFAIILAHLAILQSRTVPIHESFNRFINSHEDLANFYGTMCQQLQRMMNHTLCENVTFFMALTESVNFLSRRVRSLDLYTTEKLKFCVEYHLDEYHSYYTDILCDRVLTAYAICKFRDRAATVICDCIEVLAPYDLVIDKICSYLSHEDLRILAYPFQKSCQTK